MSLTALESGKYLQAGPGQPSNLLKPQSHLLQLDLTALPATMLLKLPLEVRQMIYVEAIGSGHKAKDDIKLPKIKRAAGSTRFSLLGVCRQLYFETRPVFFSSWRFYFGGAKQLFDFLLCIGKGRENLMEIHLGSLLVLQDKPSSISQDIRGQVMSLGGFEACEIAHKELQEPRMDPMMWNSRALLRECRNLKRLHIDTDGKLLLEYRPLVALHSRIRLKDSQAKGARLTHWVVSPSESGSPNWFADFDFMTKIISGHNPQKMSWVLTMELECDPVKVFGDESMGSE